MSKSEEETYSTIFTALKHPIRRKILRMLSKGAKSFSEMQEAFKIESSHLTYHIENLGDLLFKTKDGKYALSTFGEAATSTMYHVEETPKTPPRFPSLSIKWKACFAVLMVGLILSAGLYCVQYQTLSQLQNDYGAINAELELLLAEYNITKEEAERLLNDYENAMAEIELLQNLLEQYLGSNHIDNASAQEDTVTYDYYVVAGYDMVPTPPDPAPSPSGFQFTCDPPVYDFGNITKAPGKGYLYEGAEGTPYGSAYVTVNITNLLGYDITITNLTAEVTDGTLIKPFYFSPAGIWFGNFTLVWFDQLDPWDPVIPFDECNCYTGDVTVVRDGDEWCGAVGTPYSEGTQTGPASLVEPDLNGDAEATGHVAPIQLAAGSTFTEYFGIHVFGDAEVGTQINGTITLSLTYECEALPQTHHVYPGQSIQEAINSAQPGDTIFVHSGTYYELITIDKSISLFGEDRATTIIDAGWKDTVVSVTTDNVTVSGFTIRNAGGYLIWSCIELGASRITVKDNIITASYIGILVGGDHNTIIDNTIVATGAGMVLHRSRGNILRNNEMIDNDMSNFAVWGESLSDFFQDIDTSNLVDGKPIYYLVNQSNLIIDSSTAPHIGYLALINSRNITVRDLELKTRNDEGMLLAWTTKSIIQNVNVSNNHQGVSLRASCDNMIADNTISDNYYGISLGGSNNNTVINNRLSSNAYGINLASSEDNEIKDNVIRSSRDSGIYVGQSNYNVISYNALLENRYGIRLGKLVSRPESTGNLIIGNFISNNDCGINLGLFDGCKGNFVISNTVKNNTCGIQLHIARNNTVYHNNFINNRHQVYDESQVLPIRPSINTWDDGYPSGGNYWSDYADEDLRSGPYQNETGSDGIWDHPYEVDKNNQDKFPLVSPWEDLEPPVADAGSNQSVFKGMTVTFDGSNSTDNPGIVSYIWSFVDVTPKTLTGMQPNYRFNNVGDFEVTLNVSDYAGYWDTDTMWVHVLSDTTKPSTGIVSQEPAGPRRR